MTTKRQIKFRGRDVHTGEYRYGLYFEDEDGAAIQDGNRVYLVDRDSIVQFVGYDADGKAVYEGDVLFDETYFSEECTARLTGEVKYFYGGSNYLDDERHTFVLKK